MNPKKRTRKNSTGTLSQSRIAKAGRWLFAINYDDNANISRLKVPRTRVRFSTSCFLTLINTIWLGDLGTGQKFFHLKIEADIRRFVFLRKLSVH